jgi:hypothetical protein
MFEDELESNAALTKGTRANARPSMFSLKDISKNRAVQRLKIGRYLFGGEGWWILTKRQTGRVSNTPFICSGPAIDFNSDE